MYGPPPLHDVTHVMNAPRPAFPAIPFFAAHLLPCVIGKQTEEEKTGYRPGDEATMARFPYLPQLDRAMANG